MEFKHVQMRFGMQMPPQGRLEALRAVLIEFCGDETLGQSLINAAMADARFLECRPDTVRSNLEGLVEVLRVPRASIADACARHVALLYKSPASVGTKIDAIADMLGADRKRVVTKALSMPVVLSLDVEGMRSRFEEGANTLGLCQPSYARLCLDQFSLLCTGEEVVGRRFSALCELLEVDADGGRKAVARAPSLLMLAPERIRSMVDGLVSRVGASRDQVLRVLRRFPRLLTQRPETLIGNVEALALSIGASRAVMLAAAMKAPALFYSKPGSIIGKLQACAAELSIPNEAMYRAFVRLPGMAGRDPHEAARKIRFCTRLARALGKPMDAQQVVEACPAIPTYGMDRFRERYLLVRIGAFRGHITTLIMWSDRRLMPVLERRLAAMPAKSREARILAALLECRSGDAV